MPWTSEDQLDGVDEKETRTVWFFGGRVSERERQRKLRCRIESGDGPFERSSLLRKRKKLWIGAKFSPEEGKKLWTGDFRLRV